MCIRDRHVLGFNECERRGDAPNSFFDGNHSPDELYGASGAV